MTALFRRLSAKNFLLRYIYRILEENIPDNTRRHFFIATIMSFCCNSHCTNHEAVSYINRRMKLSLDPSMMVFPGMVGTRFWDKDSVPEVLRDPDAEHSLTFLTDEKLWQVSKQMALGCPALLIYGSNALMVADTHAVLSAMARYNAG